MQSAWKMWPLLFLNPITAFVGLGFGISRCEACYEPCSHEDVPSRLQVVQLGPVLMPDGETCNVEEVVRESFEHWTGEGPVDSEHRCVGPVSRTRPLVRRLVCPSGRNGESRVGDDGTKFHRETLE
jgi:hypothetical protein